MIIKYTHGFKIRKKEDAEKFLNDCLCGSGSIVIFVNPQHCFFIRRYNQHSPVLISSKIGDLCDCFNPEFVICENEMVDYIYKMRKYINSKFFNS